MTESNGKKSKTKPAVEPRQYLISPKNFTAFISAVEGLIPQPKKLSHQWSAVTDKNFGEKIVEIGEWKTYPTNPQDFSNQHEIDRRRLGQLRKEGLLISAKRSRADAQKLLRAICRAYLHLSPCAEVLMHCVVICQVAGFSFCPGDLVFWVGVRENCEPLEKNQGRILRTIPLCELLLRCEDKAAYLDFSQFGIVTPKALEISLEKDFLKHLCFSWFREFGTVLIPIGLSLDTTRSDILKAKDAPQFVEKWREHWLGESEIHYSSNLRLERFFIDVKFGLLKEHFSAGLTRAEMDKLESRAEWPKAMIGNDRNKASLALLEDFNQGPDGLWALTATGIADRKVRQGYLDRELWSRSNAEGISATPT